MLDFVAQRYGCLPSAVLEQADHVDVFVAMTAAREQARWQEEARTGKKTPEVPPINTLEQMLERVRKRQ